MQPSLLQAWSGVTDSTLLQILQQVDRRPPDDFKPLLLAGQRIGWLAPAHVPALCQHLDGCQERGATVVWDAAGLAPGARSALLARAAGELAAQGLITGWRNELYNYWGEIEEAPGPQHAPWFCMERAAFRFFGLRSHAVHINGFRSDGRLWCGVRALSKATDPGRIDNLAAGGLPAGETVLECAIRELHEEAGLPAPIARQAQAGVGSGCPGAAHTHPSEPS